MFCLFAYFFDKKKVTVNPLISKTPYVIILSVMKKGIHPENYRKVIFQDVTSGEMFLIGSTIKTSEKGKFEGKEYDLMKVEISSASHPFYTGKKTLLKTSSMDKFYARQKKSEAIAK